MAATSAGPESLLQSIFNHTAFPAYLPGKQDARLDTVEQGIWEYFSKATKYLARLPNNKHASTWDCLRRALDTCNRVNAGGELMPSSLLAAFRDLQVGEFIILHVSQANAGQIILRQKCGGKDEVIFESFEASPRSKDEIANVNTMLREFPGCAAKMPFSAFDDTDFQMQLAIWLSKASSESIKFFAGSTDKAGSKAFEPRETADPSLITQIIMTMVEEKGSRISPIILRKHVKDEVSWNHGGDSPWRRCPFWLVVRVATQRWLYSVHGDGLGHIQYKVLMALFFSLLLDDCTRQLPIENVHHLKAKLCRRLAKLQGDRGLLSRELQLEFDAISSALLPVFDKTTNNANSAVVMKWEAHKNSILRQVFDIDRMADQAQLYLKLPNSLPYLKTILNAPPSQQNISKSLKLPLNWKASAAISKPASDFAKEYFQLAEIESNYAIDNQTWNHTDDLHLKCVKLSQDILKYLDHAASAYADNSEQRSIMLLTIMELWMSMDICAIKLFPLLKEFSPGFLPSILDVLQIPRFKDMKRLQEVRGYLRRRQAMCKSTRKTIFDDPEVGCFGERYYNESPDADYLSNCMNRIRAVADEQRVEAEEEWKKETKKFEYHRETERATPHDTVQDKYGNWEHDHHCSKCYHGRAKRRCKGTAHEYPLPENLVNGKTLVFELNCPEAFAAYRNVTWQIICHGKKGNFKPAKIVRDFWLGRNGMDGFMKSTAMRSKNLSFCLASTTKAFLDTHFAQPKLPCLLKDICVPNGLRLCYYDAVHNFSPARQLSSGQPSFAHLCKLVLPLNSPFSTLNFAPHFSTHSTGPTAYEIAASQTKCPVGVNVHEWLAFQTLASGNTRRWPQLCIELGHSNINFGTESTTLLVNMLALQVGPSPKDGPLGTIHEYFRDETFCLNLLEQLEHRFNNISCNWRETNCMETIITITLRVFELGGVASEAALKLLEKARHATLQWILALRSEIQATVDAVASDRWSRYALWAALLCRRTFTIFINTKITPTTTALQDYISSAIALQENLSERPERLPSLLKNALIRDFKSVHQLWGVLSSSLQDKPHSLLTSVSRILCGNGSNEDCKLSRFNFLSGDEKFWIEAVIYTAGSSIGQIIHFHVLEGHLLIMGKAIGKLPPEWRSSIVLQQLFGDQSLLTYPSTMVGMTYQLAITPYNHNIHLGYRAGELVVRAVKGRSLMELIPAKVFGSSSNFDLPASLVDNCVHWLDLNSRVIEIRQQPDIWKRKDSNWQLNVSTHRATRRRSSLVCPHSNLFYKISKIFKGFEDFRHLTIFSASEGRPFVELRRMELNFFVNDRRLLQCRQLKAEIDPDQDAGTWYGLTSKLVLRDVIPFKGTSNNRPPEFFRRQRSILVPLGRFICKRHGPHVSISVTGDGGYARYLINDMLGRLDCPAEPRFMYLKALYHACTSFFLPDTLTRRTGTEEALHCLRSACSQPWTPLTPSAFEVLAGIATLTPRREYYPVGMEVMQKTTWNPNLTTTIQNDSLQDAVEAIRKKSEILRKFSPEMPELPELESVGDPHLNLRSRVRQSVYHRLDHQDVTIHRKLSEICQYDARDRRIFGPRREGVVQIVKLVQEWPSHLSTSSNLAEFFQKIKGDSLVEGNVAPFDKALLTDILDLDLGAHWGSLVALCREASVNKKHHLMFLFATLAFSHPSSNELAFMRAILAFAFVGDLRGLPPPACELYDRPKVDEFPTMEFLLEKTRSFMKIYPGDERSNLANTLSTKQRQELVTAELAHEKRSKEDSDSLAQFLFRQWPCAEPTLTGFPLESLVDIDGVVEELQPEWSRLYKNWEFHNYISSVQKILNTHTAEQTPSSPEIGVLDTADRRFFGERRRSNDLLTLRNLLSSCATSKAYVTIPRLAAFPSSLSNTFPTTEAANSRLFHSSAAPPLQFPECDELEQAIRFLDQSNSLVREEYGSDLSRSLEALRYRLLQPQQSPSSFTYQDIVGAIREASKNRILSFERIMASFNSGYHAHAYWLQRGWLWPTTSDVALLESLRSTSTFEFGAGMKEAILEWAVSIATLQRLFRIEEAYLKQNTPKFNEELSNEGHVNWEPHEQPDWLLLELDSNIMIRPDQINVARATISPSSQSNSTLQMNMGQGKTSCIMPMAAAVLADGMSLVRVVVPKPLLLQTAQLLHSRLGNLLGRELRHIPFSRKTRIASDTISSFKSIHQQIEASSGIVIALPEHILSFMLCGVQRLSDGKIDEARSMITAQSWLSSHARDILDECDNILALRTQLIYPSGLQKAVDGHPQRWETVEVILKQLDAHIHDLEEAYPQSIEVIRRDQGGFPFIHFLRRDVEDDLISRLVEDVVQGRGSFIPSDCSDAQILAIKQFISEPKVASDVAQTINQLFPDKPASRKVVYLLRGLFVHRILLMSLKKRWNVQYGLHPTREPIAVPYHAKGTPSEQAEWGHPDVAILFTCLAFYYDGLRIEHMGQTLEHVIKSDDPAQVYDRFAQYSSLPDPLREWGAINIDDKGQLKEIWQHLRHNIIVVDYFLNNFVFPKYAKQFEVKLQASGWDIPLFNTEKSTSSPQHFRSLTTGFSGTNDWKKMLPFTIAQQDLAGLSHTNAEVLTYLLQHRNRFYVVVADSNGKHIKEEGLLRMLADKHIRVLIDAGAQILEMDNETLVKTWLDIDYEAPAAIYFDKDNKPQVLYRQGRKIALLASPFAEDSGDCLVYLDEAHTRGTDLKLPQNSRGALTLGLGQTKDHTVQAAMRLRQLGTTQSITFFAPPEVNQSISDLCQKLPGETIDSFDVIRWLLEQTCSGLELLQPLHFSQGIDFCRRMQASLDNSRHLTDLSHRANYLSILKQAEQQTLEQLYGLSSKAKSFSSLENAAPQLKAFVKELNARRKHFEDSGVAVHASALQEVEQEREDEHEVEVVREVQKPYHYEALKYPGLHKDFLSFIITGRFATDSSAFEQAFSVIARSSLAQKKYWINTQAVSGKLWVSAEFVKSVKLKAGDSADHLQRPVTWILWSTISEMAIILNPEEAEELLPLVKTTKGSTAHILTYAAPITRKMLHFNTLRYYAVPALPKSWEAPEWLKIELGIYAGRLYFEYFEYHSLLRFLRVTEDYGAIPEGVVAEEVKVMGPGFTAKPLSFMQDWLALRRKGQDFSETPMGHVCQGKKLHANHPFFAKRLDATSSEIKRSAPFLNGDREEEDIDHDGWDEELRDDEVGLGGDQGPDPDIKAKAPTKEDFDEDEEENSSEQSSAKDAHGSGSTSGSS